MARNERIVDASPRQVFDVLSDAGTFGRWVVGTKDIRDADDTWPGPGSILHHRVGIGPLALNDSTTVVEANPPGLLVLEARGRPFGRARIEFRLTRSGDRQTRVTMEEQIQQPRLLASFDPLFAPLVRIRNAETLRRLAAIVDEKHGAR
jgi:uncharacterized protein YndB with AHSA1/START domain